MFGNVIDVDLVQKRPLARIHAMQGETKARAAAFTLRNDGVAWSIPEGVSVTVHYRRVDGSGGSYKTLEDGTSAVYAASSNLIVVWLSNAVCAKAGTVTLTVDLKKDGATIVTWPVLVLVSANPGCQDPVDYVEAVKWPANKYLGTDEKGNVVAREAPGGGNGAAVEQFLTLDLSGYYDGIIKRIYADGGESNLDVTFDANGNPIKFSNGVEEFTVVWPAEGA